MNILRRLFRLRPPLADVDHIGFFYLVPERTTVTPVGDGLYEITITLRGEYDYSYRNEECWSTRRLCVCIDGARCHRFDKAVAEKLVNYINNRHRTAHAD